MALWTFIKTLGVSSTVASALAFAVVTFPLWLAGVWTLFSDRPFAVVMAERGIGWLVITPYYGWFCFAVGLVLVAIAIYAATTDPPLPAKGTVRVFDHNKGTADLADKIIDLPQEALPSSTSVMRLDIDKTEAEVRFKKRELVASKTADAIQSAQPDLGAGITNKRDRIFITESLESVLSAPADATGVQITKMKAIYVGKWMRVTGAIMTVNAHETFHQVVLLGIHGSFFFDPSWAEHLDHLKAGHQITIIGRFQEVRVLIGLHLVLDNCEVEYPHG